MKKVKIVSALLVALCFICAGRNMASDSIEQERLENSIPSDNTILFKSKGKGGQALTFDIRDDIKRGQEFLKRQGCRLFAGEGGKENHLF